MAIDGIHNRRCSISDKAIPSLIKKATKEGRQFALAIITDPDGSHHYFDALLLNQWVLKQPTATNPNTRSTNFTVQYLWNKTPTDVFEPLGELPASELTLDNKKFSELNRYAVACNHAKAIKRIKSIFKIVLNNPGESKDWISALYSNFSHQLSIRNWEVIEDDRVEPALHAIFRRTQNKTVLSCLAASTMRGSPLLEYCVDGILKERPDDEIALKIKCDLSNEIPSLLQLSGHPLHAIYAHSRLSECYLLDPGVVKDLAKVKEHASKVLELDPNSASAHQDLAETYRIGGNGVTRDRAKAEQLLKKALELDPLSVNAHSRLGCLYHDEGDGVGRDHAKAETHLLKAISLAPKYALPYAILGSIYFKDRRDDAARHLIQATALGLEWAEVHSFLGEIYRLGTKKLARDFVKAETHLKKAVELEPDNAMAHARLGALYHDGCGDIKPDLAKAEEHRTKAAELSPGITYYPIRLEL